MAGFYILGCLILLAMHADAIPETPGTHRRGAFTPQAATGGFLGAGVRKRCATASRAASSRTSRGSAARRSSPRPRRRRTRFGKALVSSTGTFWDTVVVCAMTGLVVVNSGEWRPGA
jgi:AGCS family alanine or glycine:cation symporter